MSKRDIITRNLVNIWVKRINGRRASNGDLIAGKMCEMMECVFIGGK